MGRSCKLNEPGIAKAICDALAEGNTRDDAANGVEISPRTLDRWLARGRKAIKNGTKPAEGEPDYVAFCRSVKKAEAIAAQDCIKTVKACIRGGSVIERTIRTKKDGSSEVVERLSEPNWQAAFRWLECRRDEFSKHAPELNYLRKEVIRLSKAFDEAQGKRGG